VEAVESCGGPLVKNCVSELKLEEVCTVVCDTDCALARCEIVFTRDEEDEEEEEEEGEGEMKDVVDVPPFIKEGVKLVAGFGVVTEEE
jgi:hypothetical protein